MIYTVVSALFVVVERDPVVQRRWLAPTLVVFCAAFTLVYLYLPDYFTFFLLTYIGMLLTVVALAYEASSELKNKTSQRLLYAGAALYAFGFFCLWIPDQLACHLVQRFHFHAIFHLFACSGPWCILMSMLTAHYERLSVLGVVEKRPQLVMKGSVFPIVVLVKEKAGGE